MNTENATPAEQFLSEMRLYDKADNMFDRPVADEQQNKIHELNIAAAEVPATDLPNIVHRISAAFGILPMIYSQAACGEDTEDMIAIVEKLLLRGLEGINTVSGFNCAAWRFDYMAGPFAEARA